MKKVKIELDNKEEVEVKKTKNIFLWILLLVISLIGVFFLSTYIRWKADIKGKNEILYYNQENIKVNKLTDFYDSDIDVKMEDSEALLMYCTSIYGGDCITGDFSNKWENLFRNPLVIINIVVILDLLIVYLILKKGRNIKLVVYVLSGVIVLYGLVNAGAAVYDYADYYKLVNKSEYLVHAKIIRGLKTENKEYFKPVVSYETEKDSYIKYIDYDMEGTIEENVDKEITLYYDKKDNSIVTPKRELKEFALSFIVGIIITIIGFIYLTLNKKENS